MAAAVSAAVAAVLPVHVPALARDVPVLALAAVDKPSIAWVKL